MASVIGFAPHAPQSIHDAELPRYDFLHRLIRLRDSGIILTLLASIAGAWWAAGKAAQHAEASAAEMAFHHIERDAAAAELLVRHLTADNRVLVDLSQRWLSLAGPGDALRRAEIAISMRRMLDHDDLAVQHLTIADARGIIRWHTIREGLDLDISARPHFVPHANGHPGPFVGRPLIKRATQETVVGMSWRLEDAAGDFLGVAVMQYRPDRLATSLARISTERHTLVSLANLDGALLARSVHLPERLGDIVLPDAVLQALERTPRQRHHGQHFGDGRPVLVALQRVTDSNIIVVAATDEAAALAPTRRLRVLAQLAAGTYSLLVLLTIAIGYGILRSRRLLREAQMLRAGRAGMERLHARLPAVIFVCDVAPDGTARITYRTGDIRGVSGWENGELDGELDWRDYLADPGFDRFQAARDALRTGSSEVFWDLRQPDGSLRRMATRTERLTLHPDGGGEVVGYVRDYSAEQRASDDQAAIRRELETTLALAPVVVFRARVWACAGCTWRHGRGCYRKDYVSGSLEPVTGWTREALDAAGGFAAVLTPWESMIDGIEAMRRGESWAGEFQMRRPDGQQIVVRITTNVVAHHFDGMDIVGYIADVTEERDAKARAIGSARLASLGELAAGLAHELKQPLQAIELGVTNAQTAVKRGNLVAAEQRLERIASYSRRAAGVVEHLRRLARGADETAPPEPMVVEESLAAVLAMLAGPLRDAGVEVAQEFDHHPLVAIGHGVALEQVLMNLLANARDAMLHLPAEAPRLVTVRGRLAEAGDAVLLTVSDTGGGIPPAVMARLFEPFVTTKGLERGTGLGLSICQGLIRHMGGTIAAANDEKGAVFTITLRSQTAARAQDSLLRVAAE